MPRADWPMMPQQMQMAAAGRKLSRGEGAPQATATASAQQAALLGGWAADDCADRDVAFGLNEDADVQAWEDAATREGSYALEPNLATYAFVSLIKPRDKIPCDLLTAVGYPWTLLLCTYLIQTMMAYAVQDRVHATEGMMWQQLYDIYGDGLDGVTGTGLPRMSAEDAASVCGSFGFTRFNDSEATWGVNATDVWTFKYDRAPNGDWDTSIQAGERDNTLDTTMYVLTTRSLLEILDVPFSHMFKFVVFIWFCVVAADLSVQWQFLQYLCHARTVDRTTGYIIIDGADEGATAQKLLARNDDGAFVVQGLTVTAKVFGTLIALMEIFLAMWVLVVGVRFLMGSPTRLDLILNAVALGFLFELDDVVFAAGVSTLTKKFLESVELAKYSRENSMCNSRHHKRVNHLGGFLTMVLGAAVAFVAQEIHFRTHQQVFELAATLCLFLGPSPDDGGTQFDAVFPVPGLCESLLDLSCEYPTVPCYADHSDDSRCLYYDSYGVSGKRPLQFFVPDAEKESKYCVSRLAGKTEAPVSSVAHRIRRATIRGIPGIDLMRSVCLAMWQPAPCSEPCPEGTGALAKLCRAGAVAQVEHLAFQEARQRVDDLADQELPVCLGAPRRRGGRGDSQQFAAPFWCPFSSVASALLTDRAPRRLDDPAALELLGNCSGHRLPAPASRRPPLAAWSPAATGPRVP